MTEEKPISPTQCGGPLLYTFEPGQEKWLPSFPVRPCGVRENRLAIAKAPVLIGGAFIGKMCGELGEKTDRAR